MNGSELVRHALAQMGTPWRHQGRIAGIALDCWGLMIVAAKLGGLIVPEVAPYGPDALPDQMLAEAEARADRVPRDDRLYLPGDGLLIDWNGKGPQHVAVAVGDGTIVHTSAHVRCVTRQPIDDGWRRKIHSAWRLHGLEDG